MLIRLCKRFWVPALRRKGTPVPPDVHAEFQAQTIIHEASHLTDCDLNERDHSIAVPECLAQFVAATNGSWLDPNFVKRCIGTKPCRQPPAGVEVFERELSGPVFARRGSERIGSSGPPSGRRMRSGSKVGQPYVDKEKACRLLGKNREKKLCALCARKGRSIFEKGMAE
jgi:hypothetical protein